MAQSLQVAGEKPLQTQSGMSKHLLLLLLL